MVLEQALYHLLYTNYLNVTVVGLFESIDVYNRETKCFSEIFRFAHVRLS